MNNIIDKNSNGTDVIVTEVQARIVAVVAGTLGIITILICYGIGVYFGNCLYHMV